MILTRDRILNEVQFEPKLDEFQVNPHSIDLRLSTDITLLPNSSYITPSLEKVTLPDDVMAVVYPRSSANRRGIMVHMTGVVDAGYSGTLVLPLTNVTDKPIALKKGERIASLVFHRLEEKATVRLSKYHNGDGKYMADKAEETAYINAGDISGLKDKYSL